MLCFKSFQAILRVSFSTTALLAALTLTAVAAENSRLIPEKTVSDAKIESAQPDRINSVYVKGYFSDTGRIVVSPITWEGSDWLTAGLVVGAASGIYLADSDIRDFMQRNQSPIGDSFAHIGNAIGNPLFILPPLGLLYLYGHVNDDPAARRTALLAVESLTISGALAMTLKLATQRPRPHTGETSTTWDGPSLKSLDPSFPSIHTQSAFSVAAVIADQYGSNPSVAPLAYGLATLTGLSRIYSDKHWASDAFFGAALGYFTGKAVVRYHAIGSDTPVKFQPMLTRQGFGVNVEYRF